MERRRFAIIKKKALEEDYTIFYHDEATLQLCSNITTTYSPKGKTPVLSLQDTKGYQYVCLASSINENGEMFFQIRENSFRGEGIILYLKALLEKVAGKILLIWDNAPWHKAQIVKDFLNTPEGERIWLANTPPYSPELNPDEFVWANLKRVQMPNVIAKNVKELKEIAQKAMEKIQEMKGLVKSFFNNDNYHSYNTN